MLPSWPVPSSLQSVWHSANLSVHVGQMLMVLVNASNGMGACAACPAASLSSWSQIAVQIALVIAKAARFDFPQQWPSLFNDLLAGLANSSAAPAGQQLPQQQQVLLVRRTYFVLHHVLKELSSKRLAADQKAFAQVWPVGVCAGRTGLLRQRSILLVPSVAAASRGRTLQELQLLLCCAASTLPSGMPLAPACMAAGKERQAYSMAACSCTHVVALQLRMSPAAQGTIH